MTPVFPRMYHVPKRLASLQSIGMRFSLFYNFDILPGKPIDELYREVEAQVVAAEQSGFDAVWLAEHHFTGYGRLPAPLTFLARLSALTTRLGLGTATIEAPYYHPLRLAEEAALLDMLSNGRLRLGIGSGAGNKTEEFATFGVPLAEKTGMTLEIVDMLDQALSGGMIDFGGRYYHYNHVAINPRPVQTAQQLIWLAASDSTVELAGQRGYGLLVPRVGEAERHRELIARYRAALADKPGRVAQLRFVYVAETEHEAQEQTRRTFARYAKYDCGVEWNGQTTSEEYRELARRMHFVIGTPEHIIDQLAEWQGEYGFDEIICQVYAAGMHHVDSLQAIHLLGREVLPRLNN